MTFKRIGSGGSIATIIPSSLMMAPPGQTAIRTAPLVRSANRFPAERREERKHTTIGNHVYLEFLVYTSLRTDFDLLVYREECCRRMEHLENLFGDMLLRDSSREQTPVQILDRLQSSAAANRFVHRHIQKTLDAAHIQLGSWMRISVNSKRSELTRLVPIEYQRAPMTSRLRGVLTQGVLFRKLPIAAEQLSIEECFEQLFLMAFYLREWGSGDGAVLLLNWTVDAASLLHDRHQCTRYKRLLARSLDQCSINQCFIDDPQSISFNDRALNLWQDLHYHTGDTHDLGYLVRALSAYEVKLFKNGYFEESLDLSRQALLLMRSLPESYSFDSSLVAWSASGDADIVFSSKRHFVRSHFWACLDAQCLWNMAKGLAFFGRYSDAQIAASDALFCIRACISAGDAHLRKLLNPCLLRWRTESLSWVSIPKTIGMPAEYYIAACTEGESETASNPATMHVSHRIKV